MLSETPARAACPQAAATTETDGDAVLAVLNDPKRSLPACPHCHGTRLQRWGLGSGVQRFRCKNCARSFNMLTGTPLARLRRRDLWLDYAQALNEGLSIRAAGRRLGVHYNTTLRWRHRWLIQPSRCRDTALQGIVEVETVTFVDVRQGEQPWRRVAILPTADERPDDRQQHLRKERPRIAETPQAPPIVVLIARDRHGATFDGMLGALDRASVEEVLAPILGSAAAILRTPESAVFAGIADARRVAHHPVSGDARPGPVDSFRLANVHGYVRRLEHWMQRFHGVSARYLGHYLAWRRLVDRHLLAVPPLLWLRMALGRDQPPTVAMRQRVAAA